MIVFLDFIKCGGKVGRGGFCYLYNGDRFSVDGINCYFKVILLYSILVFWEKCVRERILEVER